MTAPEALQESERRFLEQIFDQTGGDPAADVSMYHIGEQLNLDRTSAKHAAETLIGMGLVEIRTLAGAVGITPEGLESVRASRGAGTLSTSGTVTLGDARVADAPVRDALDALLGLLKTRISDLGMSFEELNELLADVKSLDAQLSSPKPKTAVLRACLESIQERLEPTGERECRAWIQELLGGRERR